MQFNHGFWQVSRSYWTSRFLNFNHPKILWYSLNESSDESCQTRWVSFISTFLLLWHTVWPINNATGFWQKCQSPQHWNFQKSIAKIAPSEIISTHFGWFATKISWNCCPQYAPKIQQEVISTTLLLLNFNVKN